MKWIFVSLLMASASYAVDKRPGDIVNVRPRLYQYSNQVQVQVWNTTDTDIECRGTINIQGERNFQTEFYWETIYRGMSSVRTYWLRDFSDTVRFATEFINCYER